MAGTSAGQQPDGDSRRCAEQGWRRRHRPGNIRLDGTARFGMAPIVRQLCLLLALCGLLLVQPSRAADRSDYPTEARAEFVFACMATNGGNQEALQHCSCAIDVIASVLPYGDYEKAETVMRMRRSAGGYLGEEFRGAFTNDIVRDLDEAQAEAEVRCF
jgi:hypothetical protein